MREETEVTGVKRLPVSKDYCVAREKKQRGEVRIEEHADSQVLREISRRSAAFRLTFHSEMLESDLTL